MLNLFLIIKKQIFSVVRYFLEFFFHTKRWRLFKGRRLFKGGDYFQILFTGSRALNNLLYFPIK